MAEREIQVFNGVSWLKSRLTREVNARIRDLEEKLGKGVPLHEYGNFVGRIHELKRTRDTLLEEVFAALGEEEDDEEES